MARILHQDTFKVYRVVVSTHRGNSSYDSFYGPYDNRRTAASVGGNMVADKRRWGLVATYFVEEADTRWARADD